MAGILSVMYGSAASVIFLLTFLYAIAFVGDFWVPKTIDSGMPGGIVGSVIVDALLLGLFAVQHSGMARPAFKRWWTAYVPKPVERSTYVLLASLSLLLLYWQWRPLPQPIWTVTSPAGAALLQAAFWIGWALVLASTFLISHAELFGVRQVLANRAGMPLPEPAFKTPLFYKHVRHPIYLGFLMAFWATPAMTAGHLLFAIATTGYILIGIQLEERDLIRSFGQQYRDYRVRVRMLAPFPRRSSRPTRPGTAGMATER